MSLIPLRSLPEATVRYGLGQGVLNVNAVAQTKVVIEVHEMFRSVATLQRADLANGFTGGRTDFMSVMLTDKKIGAENIVDAVKKYGADSEILIVLHPDHGRGYNPCVVAIKGGYIPVMIDGLSLPFKEDIGLTREVVKYARARSVSVEGELGVLVGVEDHVFSASPTCTNPPDAVEFLRQTDVDALATSYGTIHDAPKGKDAELRKEIAIAIREYMNHMGIFGALVFHSPPTVPKYIVGEISAMGSELTNTYGISTEELKAATSVNISKINVDTDTRLAATRNTKELFVKYPEKRTSVSIGPTYELLKAKKNQFDPRVFPPLAMNMVICGNVPDGGVAAIISYVERDVKEAVGALIVGFGSFGKVPPVEQVSLGEMAERYRKMEK